MKITQITTITKSYDSVKLDEILQEASMLYSAAELIAASAEEQRKVRVDRETALAQLSQQMLNGKRVHKRDFILKNGFYLDGLRNDSWELEVTEEVATYMTEET